MTAFIPGAVDGWTWVVEDLVSAVESGRHEVARNAGAAVGRLVASFHRALAETARPATPDEVATWQSGVVELDRALDLSRGHAREVLEQYADVARSVLASVPQDGSPVMRVHGDLHIGQVLRSPGAEGSTYTLTDFDGNPIVPAADRVREQPAALDVAGMAQSFVHAGLVVRKHHPELDAGAVDEAAEMARTSFLDAYRAGLGEQVRLLDERLLRPFALRQVCREFIYAATHLPRWSYVPEAALPLLLARDEKP